ncbi:MAG: PAS domain-containing sensor histidine kinase [Alphaproteobacteria bacterium]|nr:PAS domain-containing sensor histidine kinase [Alphaproteobacteria bacterium]MDE2351934.1 PAS domain-containing sensor histidine kinase [Alphaproteobacteria bacterium]
MGAGGPGVAMEWHGLVVTALLLLPALAAGALRLRRQASRQTPRLTAAEKTYRAFFDHTVLGVFRTTPDGRYVDANPALARIYGYVDPAALMEGLTDIAGQLYTDAGRREAFSDLLAADDVVTDFVSEIRRRDGSTIWISETARAVRDWTGRLVFYEGTVEDVTAKIDAERALRRALEKAEEANRAKSAFLAAMSHELKTPLNGVLGFSEVIKEEMLGPIGLAAYREYAEHIHKSGRRLLEVIENVLDITRLQAGTLPLNRQALVVEPLVAAAVAEAEAAARHRVALDLAPDLPLIDADAGRLRQVLHHLLSNAMKFTPDGGAVSVRLEPEAAGLWIVVADSGIGMAPDQIAVALEPFRQIDGSLARRFEGAGLGLALTKALVDLHNGRLAIESEEGVGTTVRVWLPATAGAAAPTVVAA